MSPPFSMRMIRASRCVRAMAVFAWLMLVMVSLPVASMDMSSAMAQSGEPVSMAAMMGHGMQHDASMGGHHADGCCGNPAQPGCHCDAMCGSVLFSAVPALFGSSTVAASYASFHGIDAPTPDPIPPLRPPAVIHSV